MNAAAVRKLLGGSALALLGIVNGAHGQGTRGDDAIEDILVTARRVEERLQDVPISMTVYNQQELADRNIVNAADLATVTPSLSANSNFGSDNSSYAIRGFVQDLGTAPSVGVYFADVVALRGASNGFPVGDGAGAGAFFDLQNVQVLKGPQGTLFGRNTTGGAVLLVPQRPTYELEGYAQASAGNHDMRRLQGVLNVPLGATARMRLGIDRQTRDGYIENTSGIGPDDFVDVDYTAYRASVTVDLTPQLENYIILTYTDSSRNGDFQKLVAADPAVNLGFFAAQQLAGQAASGNDGFFDAQQDLGNPQSDLEQWQIINTTSWQLGDDLALKNILSYGQLTQDLRTAMFGTAFTTPAIAALNLPSYRFGFASIQALPGGHTSDQWTSTEELRLEGTSFDDALSWQTGAYVEFSEPDSVGGSQSPVVISCTSVADLECTDILGFLTMFSTGSYAPVGTINYTAGETRYRDVGVYAQATYDYSEQLRLTAGLRYTWDREKNTSTQRAYQFNPPLDPVTFAPLPVAISGVFCTFPDAPADTCTRSFTQRSDEPTWLIGLDYTPTDDTLVYAKYARGYRAGATFANMSPPFNLVDPEKVDAYEIGSKFTFGGDVAGTLNAAVFYNDFTNQQLQLGFQDNPADNVTVASTAGPINAGESEIYGAELEVAMVPFDGLRIQVGYTYLQTEIKSIETFVVPPSSPFVTDGQQRPGDELSLSPEHKYTITARYTLPLDESLGRVTLGADFIHTDEQISNYADRNSGNPDISELRTLPDTDLVNVNVNWDSIGGSPVDLLIFGTNVTNEKYFAYVPGLAIGTGFETAMLGQPRMYGAQLTWRFAAD
jgi:iron complex outermembrane receptor protein